MYSKEFMKFIVNEQSQETCKKEDRKKVKETRLCTGKLATILLTCAK